MFCFIISAGMKYFKGAFMFSYKTVSLLLALLLSSCATPRFTYSDYLQVEKGMTEQEVVKILGEPTKVTGGSVDTGTIGSLFGLDNLSGTTMIWNTDKGKANVIFFRGKVKTKSFSNQF
jgi:hypothetical protein